MNPKAPISARLLFYVSLLFIGSCQKIHFEDFIHPDNTLKQCRIKQILEFNIFDSDTLFWNFKYNIWGDPIRITPSLNGTGQPEIFFRYDNQHRLTDYFGAYREELRAYEFWLHFDYLPNKFVLQKGYTLGPIINGNPVPSLQLPSIAYLQFDMLGRLVRDSTNYPSIFTPILIQTYTYNSTGNLAHFKSVNQLTGSTDQEIYYTNYDNKVNISRTNRIWMFINRNYSVNNWTPAESYNQYGLPLKWRGTQGNRFIYRNIDDADIKYECR